MYIIQKEIYFEELAHTLKEAEVPSIIEGTKRVQQGYLREPGEP